MKRIQLSEFDHPEQILLIGIASDQKIWKICWELNQNLNLTLKRVEKETFDAKSEELIQLNLPTQLFDIPDSEDNMYYEDNISRKDQDFFLFSAGFKYRPKALKAFRFFFLVRYRDTIFMESAEICRILNESSNIITALDLTDFNDINPHLL